MKTLPGRAHGTGRVARAAHGAVSAALAALVLAGAAPACRSEDAASELFDRRDLGTVEIADPNVALTFARVEANGVRRVLAVTSYRDGTVTGLDLATLLERPVADPITAYVEEGYDRLRDLVLQAPAAARIAAPWRELVIPVDLHDHHIAAGTNFPEHAGEAGVENGPFLFPKLVQPTGPFSAVSAGEALLDYEVELAFVTLQPIRRGERPTGVGLVLCNDFTDRETLLRHIDVWEPESGKGFATGKSFPGYLPIGDLFVIPRDMRSFAPPRELRLYVDQQQRQRSLVSEQIWDIDELIAETWARQGLAWDHRGQSVSLLGTKSVIPERTLILSGTPAGTVFDGISMPLRLSGVGTWLWGGWDKSLPTQVVEAYVRDAHAERQYLQPGDHVAIHVDFMGVLDNEIVR